MARPLRIEYEGAFYHVSARGNERRRIFFSKSDYQRFKDYLRGAQEKYGFLIHCYVLMPNHYHLLIETLHANLSKVMHYVNASYTGYVNRKRRRSGHLFQGRYKAILIDRDSYLLQLSRYVHLNPVRAKLVLKPEDFHYSSYRSYVSKEQDYIVYHDLILEMICRDPKDAAVAYRQFAERGIGEHLADPLKNIYGGMILGSPRFIKAALGQLKEGMLHREGIAHGRALESALRSEDILAALSQQFRVSTEEILQEDNHLRNLAIYLLKKHTGLTNRQIGEMFGHMSYSGVSKAHQRFSVKLRNDERLRRNVEGVMAALSQIKT